MYSQSFFPSPLPAWPPPFTSQYLQSSWRSRGLSQQALPSPESSHPEACPSWPQVPLTSQHRGETQYGGLRNWVVGRLWDLEWGQRSSLVPWKSLRGPTVLCWSRTDLGG